MSNSYLQKRDLKNLQRVAQYLENLPPYCTDFMIAMETQSSTLTRLNYAMDLCIFFDYLEKYVVKKPAKTILLVDLDNLLARDIENYLSYLTYFVKDDKIHQNNERAKARKLASIRSFFKFLFARDLLSKNVIDKVATPKIHDKAIIRLEENEQDQLLGCIENPANFSDRQIAYNKNTLERDLAIVTLFLGTGIRISELVGLNIEDFNLKQNEFKVTRKGGNEAVLYYNDEVKDALKLYLKKREKLPIDRNEKAMFISLQNKRISVRAVEKLVQKFAKQASPLKNISPHKLRSTFGTNLYRSTKDIYIVADILGHKDVNTTKKHYAAISEDLRKNAKDMVHIYSQEHEKLNNFSDISQKNEKNDDFSNKNDKINENNNDTNLSKPTYSSFDDNDLFDY